MLKQLTTHEKIKCRHELVEIIQKLQLASHDTHLDKAQALSRTGTQAKLHSHEKHENQTLSSYFREFKARKEVRETMTGMPGIQLTAAYFLRLRLGMRAKLETPDLHSTRT